MVVEKGLFFEEQAYYAHSMNTMRVIKGDQRFSKKIQVMLQRVSRSTGNISC